jgi:hypothetical protein
MAQKYALNIWRRIALAARAHEIGDFMRAMADLADVALADMAPQDDKVAIGIAGGAGQWCNGEIVHTIDGMTEDERSEHADLIEGNHRALTPDGKPLA